MQQGPAWRGLFHGPARIAGFLGFLSARLAEGKGGQRLLSGAGVGVNRAGSTSPGGQAGCVSPTRRE